MLGLSLTERQRVAKGAKFLDKILPGWHKRVDLEKLQMMNSSLCILGQTFGSLTEKSLAEEMYPEEFKKAVARPFGSLDGGWRTAQRNSGNMLEQLQPKLGLSMKDIENLKRVCGGQNNKCEWAEEIASRLAKDTNAQT